MIERPEIAAEQAERNGELAPLNAAFTSADIAFLDAAVPFYRLDTHGILAVHGGIPGDVTTFPQSLAEADALAGKERRTFGKILRTRFVDKESGAFVMRGHEVEGDPFWAEIYDGRFGHVIFGHTPFMDGPVQFAFATGGSIPARPMAGKVAGDQFLHGRGVAKDQNRAAELCGLKSVRGFH